MTAPKIGFITFLVSAVLWHQGNGAPPTANQASGCPADFVTKFKNASATCEKTAAAALTQNDEKTLVDLPDLGISINAKNPKSLLSLPDTGIDINLKNARKLFSDRHRREQADDEGSSEEDMETFMCAFGKMMVNFHNQLEAFEKECSAAAKSTSGGSRGSEKRDDKHLTMCLEEKLEKMCPELASVV